MIKKYYFAPEITMINFAIEGVLQSLSNEGNGKWTEGGVGDKDSEEGIPDDGRAKDTSIWD